MCDGGVDLCYVVLGLEEFICCGSVGVLRYINLQYDEGAGCTDGKACKGFNAGMRRSADYRNHIMVVTGWVERYGTQANAYGERVSCQLIFPRIYDLACQSLARLPLVIR